jgi:hypothetical protein
MNEQRIFDYLEINYIIENSTILHKYYNDREYGKNICEELTTIFSIELNLAQKIAREWFLNKNNSEYNLNLNWEKTLPLNLTEPKFTDRFVFYFPEEFDIPPQFVHSLQRPSVSLKNGLMDWGDIEVSLTDPINPSMARIINDLFMVDNGYVFSRFNFKLQMLGPIGDTVEQWNITGVISQIDFGNLSYSEHDIANIKLTIKPDYVVLAY